MFNEFVITIIEQLMGSKRAVMLGQFSGTSERTWRTRLKKGWDPTDQELAKLSERSTTASIKHLIDHGGWSHEEASAILAGVPSTRAGMALPTADLIYFFSPNNAKYCQGTLQLATQFDQDCDRLRNAVHSGSLEAARDVIVDMLDWLAPCCPVDGESDDVPAFRVQLDACHSVACLMSAVKPLHESLLLHLLSSWDLEFCAGYFDGTMQAFPLFQFVMPRFAPRTSIDPETGRLSRDGQPPKRRVLVTAMSRLFDFLFFLAAWRRARKVPHELPSVKEFAAWSCESEARLVSWRDETTRFTARELDALWCKMLKPDEHGIYPSIPRPVFVCAHLWGPLLLRENGRVTGLIDGADSYHKWWVRNRDRLVAQGLRFGAQAWPAYFAEGGDALSASSLGSLHASGRSASPRDCQ